jgi:hypothetical protein
MNMEPIDDLVKRMAREMGAIPCPCCGAEPMAIAPTAVPSVDGDSVRIGSAIACSNDECRLSSAWRWEPDAEGPGAMDRALEAWNRRSIEQALRVLVSAMRVMGACQDRTLSLHVGNGVTLSGTGISPLAGFDQVSSWLEGEGVDAFGACTRDPEEETSYATDAGQPTGKAEFAGYEPLTDDGGDRYSVVAARPPALVFDSPEDEARWKDAVEKADRAPAEAQDMGYGPSVLDKAMPDLMMLATLKQGSRS